MPVVDAHCHLPESLSAQDLKTVFGMGFVDQVWALSAPLTHWVGARDNDDVVLELARSFEGKVVPFGYLNLAEGPDWVDRQRERGFLGLKAHTPPLPWDDEEFFPVYERAQDLGMPVFFHTGQAWADDLSHYPYADSQRSRSTDWMHVERLDVVIKTFPSLRVIAAHLGWPHCEAAMGMAFTHGNFYLDTSGYTGFILDSVARAMTTYGIAHRLLMGTDLMLAASDEGERAAAIRTWQERVLFWKHYLSTCFPLPQADRGPEPTPAALVLGENARRILGS